MVNTKNNDSYYIPLCKKSFKKICGISGALAIVLCEWEEVGVTEAAAILETTPKAVESRLYRARGILRERLKSWL
jgi:hypothetical protein